MSERRGGIILDYHYVDVLCKSYSLSSTWSISAFEEAILHTSTSNATLSCRIAVDSRNAAGSIGKQKKHADLEGASYQLWLCENKRATSELVQGGATDIAIASSLYKLAGAFEQSSSCEEIFLVAGDSDFLPCLQHIEQSQPRGLHRIVIVGARCTMQAEYVHWLQSISSQLISFYDLFDVLQRLAPHVCSFEGNLFNAMCFHDSDTGGKRLDAFRCARNILSSMHSLREMQRGGHQSYSVRVVVKLSNLHASFTDADCSALVARLLDELDDHTPSVDPELLGQLWVHHTAISDGACSAIARLLRKTKLSELHVSDTNITANGLQVVEDAARDVGFGQRPTYQRLYINAKHIDRAFCNERLKASTAVEIRLGHHQHHRELRPRNRGRWRRA